MLNSHFVLKKNINIYLQCIIQLYCIYCILQIQGKKSHWALLNKQELI